MPDIFDASANRPGSQSKSELIDEPFEAVDAQKQPETMTTPAVPTQQHAPESFNEVAGTSDSSTDEPRKIIRPVDEYSMVMRHEEASDNPFRAFLPKPEKIFFASQHFEEKVLLLLRQHVVTQLGWILIVTVLSLMPILFFSIGLLDFLPPNYQFATTVGWYLLLIGYALESFLSWFYNVYIITDERIVDVDFYNLLYKNISSAKIDRIEDVTTEAGGILSSVFNYGTVKIQTSGTQTEFEFDHVPQPAKVAAFINEMLVEEEKEKIEGRAN